MHGSETGSSQQTYSKFPPRSAVKEVVGAVEAKLKKNQSNQSNKLPKDGTDSSRHVLDRQNTGKTEESENEVQEISASTRDQILVDKTLSKASSKVLTVKHAGEINKHPELPTKQNNKVLEESLWLKTSDDDSVAEIKTSTSGNLEMKRNTTEIRADIEDKLKRYIESEKSLRITQKEVNARLAIAEETTNSAKLKAETETERTKMLEATIRSEMSRVKMRLKSYRAKREERLEEESLSTDCSSIGIS
eukprot:6048923-Ditylum_brightwellii.AAC.1